MSCRIGFVVVLALAAVGLAGCEGTMERQFSEPIVPAGDADRMWLTTAATPEDVPLPWLNSSNDVRVIRKVIGWLREATPGTERTVPGVLATPFGESVRGLNISFDGESGILVRLAYICPATSSEPPCYRSPDEVIVSGGRASRGEYHLRAPELARWLDAGWRDDARFGSYEEYLREARWEN